MAPDYVKYKELSMALKECIFKIDECCLKACVDMTEENREYLAIDEPEGLKNYELVDWEFKPLSYGHSLDLTKKRKIPLFYLALDINHFYYIVCDTYRIVEVIYLPSRMGITTGVYVSSAHTHTLQYVRCRGRNKIYAARINLLGLEDSCFGLRFQERQRAVLGEDRIEEEDFNNNPQNFDMNKVLDACVRPVSNIIHDTVWKTYDRESAVRVVRNCFS